MAAQNYGYGGRIGYIQEYASDESDEDDYILDMERHIEYRKLSKEDWRNIPFGYKPPRDISEYNRFYSSVLVIDDKSFPIKRGRITLTGEQYQEYMGCEPEPCTLNQYNVCYESLLDNYSKAELYDFANYFRKNAYLDYESDYRF